MSVAAYGAVGLMTTFCVLDPSDTRTKFIIFISFKNNLLVALARCFFPFGNFSLKKRLTR